MKTCGVCNETKALTEFNRKGERYQSRCRECQKAWYRDYYETSPKEKSRVLASNKAQVERIRELLREARSVPCTDCKQTYPYFVMDFDHLGDKEFTIGDTTSRKWSLEAIKAEMAKCEVVCSNCHRIRTHTRRLTARDEAVTI